jgi:pimeloyl-ACP methyl ester carboxylesterase
LMVGFALLFATLAVSAWASRTWGLAVALTLVGLVPLGLAVVRLFALDAGLTRSHRLFRAQVTIDPAVLAYQLAPTEAFRPYERQRREHVNFSVRSADNVTIRGTLIRGGHRRAIVIAHGAFRSKNTLPYVLLAQWLAYKYDVALFDFRGHGESDGTFDFSDRTSSDVQAVVRHLRQEGYSRVGVFGRSMGAWSALIAAGSVAGAHDENRIDSLVAAAAPLRQITSIDLAQRFRRMLAVPVAGPFIRLVSQLLVNIARGTRVDRITDAQRCPLDVVGSIHVPVLLIYQEWDVVIHTNIADANEMFAALTAPKDLLLLAGPGHIFEIGSFHRVCQAIENWFDATLVESDAKIAGATVALASA